MVETILVKFSHISIIYIQIERKNRYTFQNSIFYLNLCYKNCVIRSREPEPEPVAGTRNQSRSRLDRLHNTEGEERKKTN